MKYYIIAGEASGDLHGSNLIRELKKSDSHGEFRCWGGGLMKALDVTLVKHYHELAFMGFWEVILNLRTILRNIKFCKKDLVSWQPDVVVLIDYPGFNLRIAEFAKKAGFKVIYYISPQIWAWKQSRVHLIKSVVDRMLVILPFEQEFYKKFDFKVDFVGHPLLDAVEHAPQIKRDDFIGKNGLYASKEIIALLPGSRKQEISKILPEMLKILHYYFNYQFVIAGSPSVNKDLYNRYLAIPGVKIVYNQTYELLRCSKAALVTSGTATLETALHEVPEIVCYKGSYFSHLIAKRIIKTDYISLVNLIMNRRVVKELIQNELNSKNIKEELDKILFNEKYRTEMIAKFRELKIKLGGTGASQAAAKIIFNHIKI